VTATTLAEVHIKLLLESRLLSPHFITKREKKVQLKVEVEVRPNPDMIGNRRGEERSCYEETIAFS